MIGMCYSNECMGTLSNWFSKQIGDSVFGYDIMNMGSRCYHTSTWKYIDQFLSLKKTQQYRQQTRLQCGYNFRFVPLSNWWNGDDWFPFTVEAFGCSSDKVNLSSEARVHSCANGICIYLSRQIYTDKDSGQCLNKEIGSFGDRSIVLASR